MMDAIIPALTHRSHRNPVKRAWASSTRTGDRKTTSGLMGDGALRTGVTGALRRGARLGRGRARALGGVEVFNRI
ncbi:hypothetical protein R3W88_034224 [Solanum pinnatisectum]|uniref:Uncharacterized protein n=1 Tax=Solanum pinnatisectum TaxID=50273 RepID=A0AAV9JZ32_9SOLN|nr:hypothetical protein R3W88_034224 [Solanum pinnatisectum]